MKPLLGIIDRELLDGVTRKARQSPRLRMNHNFHPSDDFCSHRFLNAIEPGSYIRPHRHLDPTKDESIIVVRGQVGVIQFDEDGAIVMTKVMVAGGDIVGVDIPHGTFHTFVSLAEGSVFFEAKAGPFRPIAEAEKAPWSPVEGSADASSYLSSLSAMF
ncbi:WbuC family cupin fold metalloprotein [Geobacter sp. DSM 9736]|uniref:WbuC family cupin fold metalloprotein n=1 Tax=Geobacter sp. DSM 9736 TaxID=1277350 RepID=UPI000B508669|nr:WbuC family cupin fold metalloprotein [Geobacter sp. DSM 9736]SNB47749.1 cupin fold metalloprotein, WbuC family [Geobacter sp. DSM 9736]